jgi:hypothetical protein
MARLPDKPPRALSLGSETCREETGSTLTLGTDSRHDAERALETSFSSVIKKIFLDGEAEISPF